MMLAILSSARLNPTSWLEHIGDGGSPPQHWHYYDFSSEQTFNYPSSTIISLLYLSHTSH